MQSNLMPMPFVETLVANYATLIGGPGPLSLHGAPTAPSFTDAITLEQAYAVQRQVIDQVSHNWMSRPTGFKISLTNLDDQASICADQPTFGRLTTDHIAPSGTQIPLSRANGPLVEPELVMRATSDLTADLSDDELLASIEITGGLEIPVSRIPGWLSPEASGPLTLGRFVSDNSAAGLVVVGDSWVGAAEIHLPAVTVQLTVPDGSVLNGSATHVLKNPLHALRWLLENLKKGGESVPTGSIVSSGTLRRPTPAETGAYSAHFSHDLGDVSASFIP